MRAKLTSWCVEMSEVGVKSSAIEHTACESDIRVAFDISWKEPNVLEVVAI